MVFLSIRYRTLLSLSCLPVSCGVIVILYIYFNVIVYLLLYGPLHPISVLYIILFKILMYFYKACKTPTKRRKRAVYCLKIILSVTCTIFKEKCNNKIMKTLYSFEKGCEVYILLAWFIIFIFVSMFLYLLLRNVCVKYGRTLFSRPISVNIYQLVVSVTSHNKCKTQTQKAL